jgi:uncharacterized integral membrane protein (TIGR00698 family)
VSHSKNTQRPSLWPGLALSIALGGVSWWLGRMPWPASHGLSALTLAILLGMALSHTVYPSMGATCGPGVGYAKQTLLRLGIVFYGLRLTLQDLGLVGSSGLLIDVVMLTSTFALALFLGRRWLRMDLETAALIGAGSAVCGAAAVLAAEPVVKARSEQVSVAVATVVVFGSVAMFVYPLLYDLNTHWQIIPGGANRFGIYVGSTIHEVAQVLAAARAIDPAVADTAVIAKMARVMMLAPMLLLLSWGLSRYRSRTHGDEGSHFAKSVPWFAVAFVAMVLLHPLLGLPKSVLQVLNEVDTVVLATAMGALGLSTHASAIRRAGPQPLTLAAVLFAWLVIGGAVVNRLLSPL